MKLVPDWKKALKWWSTQIHSINAAFLLTWAAIPDKFQDALPVSVLIGIAAVLLVAGVVARMLDQEPK